MMFKSALILFSIVIAFVLQGTSSSGFKARQMSFERVRSAAKQNEVSLKRLLASRGLSSPLSGLFIRAFKREGIVELWGTDSPVKTLTLIKEYKVCAGSGGLGPKRRAGDGQVPEGLYFVNRFNPVSNFHLSLGLDYPNASDRILGNRGNLGGDIFIHGGCATIGCIPITDSGINEVYLLAVEAKSAGQSTIPVHIFPARLDESGISRLRREYRGNQGLVDFWLNLKEVYDSFERTRRVPSFRVDRGGRYVVAR
jgi:murein L,D-transpeptidase YafK